MECPKCKNGQLRVFSQLTGHPTIGCDQCYSIFKVDCDDPCHGINVLSSHPLVLDTDGPVTENGIKRSYDGEVTKGEMTRPEADQGAEKMLARVHNWITTSPTIEEYQAAHPPA